MNKEPVAWIGETLMGRQYINGQKVELPVGTALYTQDQLEEARKLGMQQERALWNLSESTQEIMDTNPVNACKHGVDDGACKECYQDATEQVALTQVEIMNALTLGIPLYTHPIKDINEAIEIIKDFQNSDVPPCKDYENTYADGWMDACNEILWAIEEKAQEK